MLSTFSEFVSQRKCMKLSLTIISVIVFYLQSYTYQNILLLICTTLTLTQPFCIYDSYISHNHFPPDMRHITNKKHCRTILRISKPIIKNTPSSLSNQSNHCIFFLRWSYQQALLIKKPHLLIVFQRLVQVHGFTPSGNSFVN